ncbi:MAG: MFS transporter [Candidatus Andeanibacterium colombiense]|uniref:MFS transporter n=1 Tax=Candidatus Andeanibacterium colombiense TaxID=3121345 RepID=A0AAJ5X8L9_9SPHN|nr:MAG: MFS transporter [Sphingomonadaceae bacterium]
MSEDETAYVFKPHERGLLPGSPATPEHPTNRRLAYVLIGSLVGLTGGLGNALGSVNLTSIAGGLELDTAQSAWFSTVYVMTNVSMSLLLVKFRQQFGLIPMIRIFLPFYALVTLGHVFVHGFATALIVRGLSGIAASALSSVGLLYLIQGMPAKWRLKGIVLGIGIPQLATPLARMFSPELLEYSQWHTLYVFEFGLALLSLAAVGALRLPPSERIKAFEPLDAVSFPLYAVGVGMLSAVLGLGRTEWWVEARWMGYTLCGAIALLAAAIAIEHNRANPLLNIRWMASADVLRFAAVAVSVRVLLSEQGVGAVGLLTSLGMTNDQYVTLFAVVTLATVAGLIASALTVNPLKLGWPIMFSLALIAVGSVLDSDATNLTGPDNLYFSQALIAFAAIFFMGPTLLIGILRAMVKGPNHLVSFSAIFSITQSVGGLAGAAGLGSFQILRERFHSEMLVQTIVPTDPTVAGALQQYGGAYGPVIGDPVLRQAQGAALLSQQVSREANILAWNDVFMLIAALSIASLLFWGLWLLRVRRSGVHPMAEPLAALARMRGSAGGN